MLIRESTLRRLIRQTLREGTENMCPLPPSTGTMSGDIWAALIGGTAPAAWIGAGIPSHPGLGDVTTLSGDQVKMWSAWLAIAMHNTDLSEAIQNDLVSPRFESLRAAQKSEKEALSAFELAKQQRSGGISKEKFAAVYAAAQKAQELTKSIESTPIFPHPMSEPLRSGKPWSFENAGEQYSPDERKKITEVIQKALGLKPTGIIDSTTAQKIWGSISKDTWVSIQKYQKVAGVADPFCETSDTELYKRAEAITKRSEETYKALTAAHEAQHGASIAAQTKARKLPSKADLADTEDEFKFDK